MKFYKKKERVYVNSKMRRKEVIRDFFWFKFVLFDVLKDLIKREEDDNNKINMILNWFLILIFNKYKDLMEEKF